MLKSPYLVLCAVLGVAAAFILATASQLPDLVASKFGLDNAITVTMRKYVYMPFMLAMAIVVPLLIAAPALILARVYPRIVNIPNRNYWLADAQRADTTDWLDTHMCRLACLVCAMVAGMHYAILKAHSFTPPHFPANVFWTLMAVFFFCLGWWMWAFYRRFRRPVPMP